MDLCDLGWLSVVGVLLLDPPPQKLENSLTGDEARNERVFSARVDDKDRARRVFE